MADSGSDDRIAFARELERRDADLAEQVDAVHTALLTVDDVRARARRVRLRLEAIPAEIEHAERVELDARAREAEACSELAEAQGRLEEVRRSRRAGQDARDEAERAVRRASVVAGDASAAAGRARERLEAVVREEAAVQVEAEGLALEARDAAAIVAGLPRVSGSGRSAPGASPAAIEEWGARVHAALFVVSGGLESERERLLLEANMLAASVLGDHGGVGVALVRQRLEETLGRG